MSSLGRRQWSGLHLAASAVFATTLVGGCAVHPKSDVASDASKTRPSCHTEMVAMRDGVRLATDIYMPSGPGPHPIVLMRNPYGYNFRGGCDSTMSTLQLLPYARDGYVALSQDVRGTSRSEGLFTPFFQEQKDGYDAIEWAAAQPWSNGKVSLVSGSYLGVTQWQAALTTPPHLRAVTPSITAADYHDDWIYRNGVFDPLFSLRWASEDFAADQMARKLRKQAIPQIEIDIKTKALQNAVSKELTASWMQSLSLTGDWNPTLKELVPFYFEWLKHPSYDNYWAKIDVGRHYHNIKVPAIISGAWYDLFATGTIDSFVGMRREAGSELARNATMLVMAWGGHAAFGPIADGSITWGSDPTDLTLTHRFIDHYGKGADNGIEREPRVQLAVLVPPNTGIEGSSFLYKTTDFPVPGTLWSKYFLQSAGHANTNSGDGVLGTRRPQGVPDHYSYNPANPVPTLGGTDGATNRPAGAFDQSTLETRRDVLVYKSAVLTEDCAVIGPVSVSLWAKSSSPDTDFTAKLVDVHPDGYAHNVVDRIVRARYRNGSQSQPELTSPGRAYRYEIPLGSTATIFRKGHRILLEVSSSNFPHYARNLNTGLSNEDTALFVSANQTILHDNRHPSYLLLPVVPDITIPKQTQ